MVLGISRDTERNLFQVRWIKIYGNYPYTTDSLWKKRLRSGVVVVCFCCSWNKKLTIASLGLRGKRESRPLCLFPLVELKIIDILNPTKKKTKSK